MLWFSWTIAFAGVLILYFAVYAYFAPMVMIMEKIGGGAR